jgi:heat shock protein HspQ
MPQGEGKFQIGEVIHHRLFDYLGVVFDVDPVFAGSEEWYETVARSRPPRDEPWYHVLVDGAAHTTYVAERNLAKADEPRAVKHPLIGQFFSGFDGARHTLRRQLN